MKRREFLAKTAATTTVIALSSVTEALAVSQKGPIRISDTAIRESAAISPQFRTEVDEFFDWLNEKGWAAYIQKITGINIGHRSADIQNELFADIDVNRFRNEKGFDDFAGKKLIEPGEPAFSLLFHALASPRVKLVKENGATSKDDYADIKQLDILENFIYALKPYDKELLTSPDTVVAVFAYEYRTAFKTPHNKHADLVFSRTGISRIGDKALNYDSELRCFVNLPKTASEEKHIAVTATRYAVFLAKVVRKDALSLMSEESRDEQRSFLLPFRKLFNNDLLLDNTPIVFSEYHCSEKLHRLSIYRENEMQVNIPPGFDINSYPFKMISATQSGNQLTGHNCGDLVTLTQLASSAILAASPAALIRPAIQNGQPLRFQVPVLSGKGFTSNRRYTSLKLQYKGKSNAYDYILTEFFFKRSRATRFSAPRNAPLFVNIRNEVTENNGTSIRYLGPALDGFENEIGRSYWAAMFIDGICDGCVHAQLSKTVPATNVLFNKMKEIFPAFSLVTAPDYFPDADSYDLEAFDSGKNSLFLQGGIENLSTGRKRPNPATLLPGTTLTAFPEVRVKDENNKKTLVYDTLTAVFSQLPDEECTIVNLKFFTKPQNKDYTGTSFLPDTASFIFAPGWDATYSGNSSRKTSEQEIFLATYGLGSPFAEDMKLCAAANGMWPVASPDASRTFKATIEPLPTGLHGKLSNPVSVPLMDDEIGLHRDSPAVKQRIVPSETFGWDGEQGPFLEKTGKKTVVNFTDIGRADYVQNMLNNNTDMSKLRKLSTATLIARMEALRVSVKKLEKRDNAAYSRLWLVSAEEVADWTKGATASGIPADLFGNNNNWAKNFQSTLPNTPTPGYLFAFAKTNGEPVLVDQHGKRKRQDCTTIYVCQVTATIINWTRIDKHTGSNLTWQTATKKLNFV